MDKVNDRLQEQIEEIINLSNSGLKQKEIAKRYNTSTSSIGRIFRQNGIRKRKPLGKRDIEDIIVLYRSGTSIQNIGRMYHKNSGTISKLLKSNGVEIEGSQIRNQKYTLNEAYFDQIDCQDKAYIYGLLMADGNVYHNTLTLSLQEEDRDILEKINRCLGSNRPLTYINYKSKYPDAKRIKNQYSLSIVNKHMINQLKCLGLIENKSLKTQMPVWISDELFPHLLRGLIDGDGSITKSRFRVSLLGTQELITSIQFKLSSLLNLPSHIYKYKKCRNTFSLTVYGQFNTCKLLNYVYNDAHLFLQRKYQIVQTYYINNPSVA